ncbi:hypothetical protein PRIC1_004348 [Phytophthora ramorum]|uniref:uncharacterized protein n=1 Tax=Phytophthora ramorum TaxID=164328 RepID=UPI003097FC15|nr:hypothetical protein KRP23_4101 [Phytophthora ramorum]
MNSAEFRELRRKLRMQVASRRFRKRRKDESRQRKMQIQALQAELAHLRDVEGQIKRYEHLSVQSLQEELHIHEQEVASLSDKVLEAAKEELQWVER